MKRELEDFFFVNREKPVLFVVKRDRYLPFTTLNKQTQIEISTIHRSRERLGRVEETIARQELREAAIK